MIDQRDGGADTAKQSVVHNSNAEQRKVRSGVRGKSSGATRKLGLPNRITKLGSGESRPQPSFAGVGVGWSVCRGVGAFQMAELLKQVRTSGVIISWHCRERCA